MKTSALVLASLFVAAALAGCNRAGGPPRPSEFYDDIPFPTFPKSMHVTSRTDLSLQRPMSRGTLVYKRADFRTELERKFPEATRRLEKDE